MDFPLLRHTEMAHLSGKPLSLEGKTQVKSMTWVRIGGGAGGPGFKLALTTGEKGFGYLCPACGDCLFRIAKY